MFLSFLLSCTQILNETTEVASLVFRALFMERHSLKTYNLIFDFQETSLLETVSICYVFSSLHP